jgi:membrane-associated protein
LEIIKYITSPEFIRDIISWGGYLGLFIVIFSETGLLVGFFLPGDSLLVTAGLFAATPINSDSPDVTYLKIGYLLITLIPAALLGNSTGYLIGRKAGPKLFTKEKSLLFRKDYLLKTKTFYEKYGGSAIIIGQFMPIIRTFAAVVAGIGQLKYSKFIRYNMIGAFTWIPSMTLLGYFLGRSIPNIEKHIEKVIIVIVILSISPIIYKFIKHKLIKRKK